LLRHKPAIVHYCGHGEKDGALVLSTEDGKARIVPPVAMAKLLAEAEPRIECVVLNSCYSSELAEKLAKVVGCVVGMSSKILDDSALVFAHDFYTALAYGKTYEKAFRLGCIRIDLENLPDVAVPRFYSGAAEITAKDDDYAK
jgi:hypothetical protein